MTKTKRICMWSGPRNISTAMMYSFAQREDTMVVDEPLYAHYLRVTNVPHPGRIEVLHEMDSDGEKVVKEVILGDYDKPVVFFKQMTHHLIDLDFDFLDQTVNFLLIRHPYEMLCSYAKVNAYPTMRDIGMRKQKHLFDYLAGKGQSVFIVDAKDILLNPKGMLTSICNALDIEFSENMLSWRPGPIKEDGYWAKFWYSSVHRSSGFQTYSKKNEQLPENLLPLYEDCKSYYDYLYEKALKIS